MSDFDLVVKGNVVLPDRIVEQGYVAVRAGRIVAIGEGPAPMATVVHDARGCWVAPGAVDGQIHAGSSNHEWLGQASKAAAAGGVSTIVDMPYDEPEPAWTSSIFKEKIARGNRECHTDFALYATIRADHGLNEIPGLIEAGACAFKFSTFEAHPTRFPRITDDVLHDAMSLIAPSGLACGVHNQDQELTSKNMAALMAAGDTGWDAFARACNPLVENLATARVYELGALTGARAHAVHISLSRGFDIAAMYKRAGFAVSTETCVQYLMLSEEEHAERLGARCKHYPPIRPKAEVEKLWTHIAAGNCNFVSSDHVAWGLDRKNDPNIFRNASGGPGLETLVPAFWTGCFEHGLDATTAVRMLCQGPAEFFRLQDKGVLAVGKHADIAIIEPARYRYDPAKSHSAVQWSSFEGREFLVKIAATYVRGALAWDGASVINAPGSGQFQRPVAGAPVYSEVHA